MAKTPYIKFFFCLATRCNRKSIAIVGRSNHNCLTIIKLRKEVIHVNYFLGVVVFGLVLLIGVAVMITFIAVGIYLIKALRKYVKSSNVRKEKTMIKKSLGEVLKQHREECKMTQEFVAESIGVSRQAVSKWETGASDPSTSNLLTLAKLYNTTAEELLSEVQ